MPDSPPKIPTIPFSLDSRASLDHALDHLMTQLPSFTLLAFGEPLHGEEKILTLRNWIFQRLVDRWNFTAIALESCFTRAWNNRDAFQKKSDDTSLEKLCDTAFSHNFGKMIGNRQLVEFVQRHNTANTKPLHLYGFDGPMEAMWTDSPRKLLTHPLTYLTKLSPDNPFAAPIEKLLGEDAPWETQDAAMDPSKSIGNSPVVAQLRIHTEDLIAHLQRTRPTLIAQSSLDEFNTALHFAVLSRQLLTYHTAIAKTGPDRLSECLGLRDFIMAENLKFIAHRESERSGRTFLFAHNGHLQRQPMKWQLGATTNTWWPAGAHATIDFPNQYIVIGGALGKSENHAIAAPEENTVEAILYQQGNSARFCKTADLPQSSLPKRSGSAGKNYTYFPLESPHQNFDYLAMIDEV